MGIVKILLIVIFFLFSFSESVYAATYYVSPSGNDNNDGTSNITPFRTIPKAINNATGSDTIEVLSGTYPKLYITKSGPSPTNRITLKGNGATIMGDGSGNAFNIDGNNWNIDNFTVTEGRSHGVHIKGKNIYLTNIIARNNVTENRGNDGTCGNNNGWGSGFSIKLGAENIILDNIQVYQNCGEGLAITRAINVKVSKAIVYDNFSVNIYPDNSKDVLIQNSISYCTGDAKFNRNNQRPSGISVGEEDYSKWGDPHWGSKLENLTLINNIVYSCHSGIKFYSELNSGLKGGLFAHNTIVDIKGMYGLSVPSFPNNTNIRVYNNITSKAVDLGSGTVGSNNITTTTYSQTLSPQNPLTFIPAIGSSAVNSGITNIGVNTDFRNATRPVGNAPDIGAFEVGVSTDSTPSPDQTKPGDLNGDGKVDLFDYTLLVSKFGNPYTIFDYNKIVANYGK